MSASTAFVLIGHPHQNEVAVYPEFLLRLEEGHVARWIIQPLSPSSKISIIEPDSPREIGPTLINFISRLIAESSSRLSVVVSGLEGSSINFDLSQIASISDCDVHIQTTAFSSVYSVWTGKSHVTNQHQFGISE